MTDGNDFAEFLSRVRAGDEQAAVDLVRHYEPLIRREVRLHLEDQRLCRVFDSMDVCQSVLASFFVRTAAGQYDLNEPRDLVKLLVTMARNKLASAARRQHRQRRDNRRVTGDGDNAMAAVSSTEPTPSQHVAGRELLERLHRALMPDERQLVELRSRGLDWDEIAAQLGGTPHGRRMQHARALDRVAKELELDGPHE